MCTACVHMLSYVVITLFLAMIVTCLNTFFFIYIYMCLTLNCHMISLNLIHLHVTPMVCFKASFLSRTIKYYLNNKVLS